MFSTLLKAAKIILSAFKLQFANAFKLDQSTNLSYGNALNLILSKLADSNFKFDENGTEFSERLGKHCRKRRNCSLQAISSFLNVFKRLVFQTHKTRACLVKSETINYMLHYFIFKVVLTPLLKRPFDNIDEKKENSANRHFLSFQQCFLLNERQLSFF